MSNANCPHCGTEVENQFGFGMLECTNCHQMFMMESEGGGKTDSNPLAEEEPKSQTQTGSKIASNLGSTAPESATEGPVSSDPGNFGDVTAFGNTQVEAGGAGALFFDIEISGIDTPELKRELEYILSDKKLNLSPYEFMSKIESGVLKLKQVHPVRAAVLVGRLRETHLDVKWDTGQMISSLKTLILTAGLLLGLVFSSRGFANPWEYHDASLKNYSIRINNLQDEIHELIVKKNHETDAAKKADFLEEIKKKYADLRTAHKGFLKEMEHVRFEHPDRGDKAERKYHHMKIKTLEELESDNTLDGQLTKIKRHAEEKYSKPEPSPSPTKPASHSAPAPPAATASATPN